MSDSLFNQMADMTRPENVLAEFMGFEPIDKMPVTGRIIWSLPVIDTGLQNHYFGPHRSEQMRFNTSWDWLMPVVKKTLNELRLVNWPTHELKEWANSQRGRLERKLWDCLYSDCTMQEFSHELAEIIKWYNQQKL